MSRPAVLVSAPIHQVGLDLLAGTFEVRHVYHHEATQPEIDTALADADAVIVRSVPITASALAASPRLRVIAKHGAGLDSVDVDAATDMGIVVANSGDANSGSVAEHAVALMLAVLHDVPAIDHAVRMGGYSGRDKMILGDLSGAVVGLIGFGNIARRVAEICRGGFESTILAYDPMVSVEDIEAVGARKVDDLRELLTESDVVSLHVPLIPTTEHLIGIDELKLMKSDSIIVNTSRGGTLDESALLDALREGRLRGAGLDVLEYEPPALDAPILLSDRVVVSPHVAGGTELARKRAALSAAQAAIDVFEGRWPKHLINTNVRQNNRAGLKEAQS